MKTRFTNFLLLMLVALPASSAELTDATPEARFDTTVRPFLQTYCFECHNAEKKKGHLDLSVYTDATRVSLDFRQWETILEKIRDGEMPPEEAKKQPSSESRQQIVRWIQSFRKAEAQKNAGDPGPVLARRLSNAEYDYTIRDLTGVDIRPAREFPIDPANQAGFDNSGESLAMSPALVTKYLEAARNVADHLVLKPSGFDFATHPVVTDPDRDKYCVQRIIEFYEKQPTNLARYFEAAWRFHHRDKLGPETSLVKIAAQQHLSVSYLSHIWHLLTDTGDEAGPLATLRNMWWNLGGPDEMTDEVLKRECLRLAEFVGAVRERLVPDVKNLAIRGIAAGSQPFVLWKDEQMAANHRRYDPSILPLPSETFSKLSTPLKDEVSAAISVPNNETERAHFDRALEIFCSVFPDAFFVKERVLVFLKEDKDSRGRLLSAGFHLMTGYFRDDQPLYDLILDEQGRRELDTLWEEFHFITCDFARQYRDFIFFERAEPPRFMQGAEFDFARSENNESTSPKKIEELAEAYLAKARHQGGEGTPIQAITRYFKNMAIQIRQVEESRLASEAKHLSRLLEFAERAFRRPLSSAERDDLLSFYKKSREGESLSHEEALRDTIVAVLMSPSFCYRVLPDNEISSALGTNSVTKAFRSRPLDDYALASRLSYFLWSSMPDGELLARAAAGDLHQPEVLRAQAKRLLQDPRARGFATEFAGNWLDFRRFEDHNAVDRQRFPSFNNELRTAMFEEPVHFFLDVVQEDRSILDFIYGTDTFVNAALAQHYGIPTTFHGSNQWIQVENVSRYGRGGLLAMSVFLTQNSPGLRTSPVKRGYWVVRRLLGEQIPPPPPKVPELPSDETKLGDLTLREVLARHREDKSCASCHERFDSLGLVFEGYGPVGERRQRDLGDRPVDTRASFPGGGEGQGLEGLQRYLREHRQEEFVDNICRKLLAYALGRTLLLSDDSIIETMRSNVAAQHYRFGVLIDTIVTSPQFLNRRASEHLTSR